MPGTELSSVAFSSADMASTDRTVARIVTWEGDEFGILVNYGEGQWRKYRVGTLKEARKELERLCLDKQAQYRSIRK